MKKHILFAALMAAALSLAAMGFVGGASEPGGTRQQPSGEEPASLREKARGRGQHTVYATPGGVKRYRDVAALVRDSTAVVVGTVESQVSRFHSPAESNIVTDSRVFVQDVLKGTAAQGEYITVREPGGRIQFEDGTSAEVRMPDYWKSPQAGRDYVFFLKQKGVAFLLFGGPQGLFEITAGGDVEAQTRQEDGLTQKYSGKSGADFLEEIRQAVQQP